MKMINDDALPIERQYEAQCPRVGAPLTEKIALKLVLVDIRYTKSFVQQISNNINEIEVLQVDLPKHVGAIVVFVCPDTVDTEQLQSSCNSRLHSYLCPHLICAIKEIPKVHGSVDSRLLREHALKLYSENTIVAPTNEVQMAILQVWKTLLKSDTNFSIKDNFFDVGGDSLKAGQVISSIRSVFKTNLSVADLFQYPTIEELADKIKSKLESRDSSATNRETRTERYLDGGLHPAVRKGAMKHLEIDSQQPTVSPFYISDGIEFNRQPFLESDENFSRYDSYEHSIKNKSTGQISLPPSLSFLILRI